MIDPYAWLTQSGLEYLHEHEGKHFVDLHGESLSAWQIELLKTQVKLRNRSSRRIRHPGRWLWTERSYAQSSDWLCAAFKSQLFPENSRIVDACCGAGADLVALAERGSAIGIERELDLVRLANHNVRANHVQAEVELGDATELQRPATDSWLHIDPDRGGPQAKTTRASDFEPSLEFVSELAHDFAGCLIKVAPSTDFDPHFEDAWLAQSLRLWLGNHGECKQQVLCLGDAISRFCQLSPQQFIMDSPAQNRDFPDSASIGTGNNSTPGRVAVLLHEGKQFPASSDFGWRSYFATDDCPPADLVEEVEDYLYDSHAVLHASQLQAHFAAEQGWNALTDHAGFYTSSTKCDTPWAQCFQVQEVLPWDDRQVRKYLRSVDPGVVEVKNRLLRMDANHFQKRYSASGSTPIVLMVTRVGKRTRAIVCQRC